MPDIDDVFRDELLPKAPCGHPVRGEGGPHICSLCSGVIEVERDTYGNDGWACGHNAAPIRDPRTEYARCCYRCSQTRVVPRRTRIMQFLQRIHSASRTPFDALNLRDAVVTELLEMKDVQMAKRAMNAEIVVWDKDLTSTAVRGSESFIGQPVEFKPTACEDTEPQHMHAGVQLFAAGGMCWLLDINLAEARAMTFNVSTPRFPITVTTEVIRQGELISDTQKFWMNMAAMLAFMDIEVVQRESAHLPRQTKRALARAGKQVPSVIVVRLRRLFNDRQPADEKTEVQWKHRWMVHFHWRRQWYSAEKKHKVIPIAPYIKGPEGRPFLPSRPKLKLVNR